jgi:hypothetical protein
LATPFHEPQPSVTPFTATWLWVADGYSCQPKALGLDVPLTLLAISDEVIELVRNWRTTLLHLSEPG